MNDQVKRNCYQCHGTGTVIETRVEQDVSMSVVMGSLTGTGYMPTSKMVTETKMCMSCGGTGRQR